MFEGVNTITFSKESAKQLLSTKLSQLFSEEVEVTNFESDYKGLTLNFKKLIEEKTGA